MILFVGVLCVWSPPLDWDMYRFEIHRGRIGNGINDVDGRDDGEILNGVSI